jgi:hypothetical protein
MRTIVTPASPRQTHEAGAGSFRTGDVAVWLKSDADIPDGSQGVVLGFKANGRVRLRFDALGGKEFSCPGPPGGVQAPSAFPTANHFLPGAFVWARRAPDGQERWFPARAVNPGELAKLHVG